MKCEIKSFRYFVILGLKNEQKSEITGEGRFLLRATQDYLKLLC